MQTITVNVRPTGRYELRDKDDRVVQRYDEDDLEKAEAAVWLMDRGAVGGPHKLVDTQTK